MDRRMAYTHTETFSESYWKRPNLDYNYHFRLEMVMHNYKTNRKRVTTIQIWFDSTWFVCAHLVMSYRSRYIRVYIYKYIWLVYDDESLAWRERAEWLAGHILQNPYLSRTEPLSFHGTNQRNMRQQPIISFCSR